jgi:hypothetical protein
MRLIRYLLLTGFVFVYVNDAQAQRKKKKQEDVKIDKAVDAVASAVKDKLKDDKKKGPQSLQGFDRYQRGEPERDDLSPQNG